MIHNTEIVTQSQTFCITKRILILRNFWVVKLKINNNFCQINDVTYQINIHIHIST